MATSVISTLNGVFSNGPAPGIRSDTWNGSDYERVGQFGFNPYHGVVAAPALPSTRPKTFLRSIKVFTVCPPLRADQLTIRWIAAPLPVRRRHQLADAAPQRCRGRGRHAYRDYFNNLTTLQVPTYFLSAH
jgi:hypothetical protein